MVQKNHNTLARIVRSTLVIGSLIGLLAGCTKRVEEYIIDGRSVILEQYGIGSDRRNSDWQCGYSQIRMGDTTIFDGDHNGIIGDNDDEVKFDSTEIGYHYGKPYVKLLSTPESGFAQRMKFAKTLVNFNTIYQRIMNQIDSLRGNYLNNQPK